MRIPRRNISEWELGIGDQGSFEQKPHPHDAWAWVKYRGCLKYLGYPVGNISARKKQLTKATIGRRLSAKPSSRPTDRATDRAGPCTIKHAVVEDPRARKAREVKAAAKAAARAGGSKEGEGAAKVVRKTGPFMISFQGQSVI